MASYDHGRGAYYAKCLMNPKLRTAYRRAWLDAMRRQGWRKNAREILAAAEFTTRRLSGIW
jgi:hypothetical protein